MRTVSAAPTDVFIISPQVVLVQDQLIGPGPKRTEVHISLETDELAIGPGPDDSLPDMLLTIPLHTVHTYK